MQRYRYNAIYQINFKRVWLSDFIQSKSDQLSTWCLFEIKQAP